MRELLDFKEWLTVLDAAKHLSILFKEEVTEADVLQLAFEKKLKLSIHILMNTPAKRTEFLNKADLENYPQFYTSDANCDFHQCNDLGNAALSVREDKIQFLVGTLDLPMIDGKQAAIERKFRQLLGLSSLNENYVDSIYVEDAGNFYELQEQLSDPIYLNLPEGANLLEVQRASAMQGYIHARNFPSDAILVVRISSLREFEQAVIRAPTIFDKTAPALDRTALIRLVDKPASNSESSHTIADGGGTIGVGQGIPENQCEIFRAMKILTADEVSVTFVGDKTESGIGANSMLEISARGETRRVALAALDLVDRRQGSLNSQGGILLGMAQKKKLTRTEPNAAKMTRLREVFRKHLGINDDPFGHYRKGVGWEPHFKIFDNRGAADKRAKREAERRTESYEQLNESGEKGDDTNQSQQSFDSENDATGGWLKDNDPDAPA